MRTSADRPNKKNSDGFCPCPKCEEDQLFLVEEGSVGFKTLKQYEDDFADTKTWGSYVRCSVCGFGKTTQDYFPTLSKDEETAKRVWNAVSEKCRKENLSGDAVTKIEVIL